MTNQHHRLSVEQVVSLARGGGSPDAVAALRAGQLSKHMVMILTVVDMAREACPETWDELNQAFEVLLATQRTAPESINALLEHPQVGLWAARCLRRLRGSGAENCPLAVEVSQLAAVAAVAGVNGGYRYELPVRLRQGTVMLPTVGVATFPDVDPWAPATIRYDGLRLVVSTGDQVVDVPADPAQDAPGWFGLRRLDSRPAGAEITVEFVDLGPTREGTEATHLTRLTMEQVEQWQQVFDASWRILAAHYPERAASIRAGLVSIAVPEPGLPTSTGMSATMRDAFGHFLSTFNDDAAFFAETMVHEFQHSKLNALADLAPLHDGVDELIYFAPWRRDPRHLEGLFQGAYAFLGITDYWRVMRLTLDGGDRLQADFEFARWRHQLADAIEVLLGSGRLTPAGVRVVEQMRQAAAAWTDEAVDATAQEFADRVVAEIRLYWLLTNRHLESEAIAGLADAWMAGDACPIDVTAITARLATDGNDRVSERLGLLKTRLTDPQLFADLCATPAARAAAGLGETTDADLAYVTDDYREAVRLATARLTADGPVPETDPVKLWAGLALAVAADQPGSVAGELLTRAPEVVAAVHREVTRRSGAAPDPVALATWLAAQRVPVTS